MIERPTSPGRRLMAFAVDLRRHFHMNPELGLEETETQREVRRVLRGLGIRNRPCGGTGVLGRLRGTKPGPTLLLRADMDALPVTEANDVPYASKVPGRMHACGHDGHMAVLLATARHFREVGLPRGTLLFCFQPGEEGFRGAEKMIGDGVLDDPRPDAVFALHLWRELRVGTIGVLDGPCMAAVDLFTITIRGKGGHAAYPHLSTDPVLAAAHVVTALQSVVSREVDPLDTAVVTVGAINGGTAPNVIPGEVVLRGTCRTFLQRTRRLVRRRVTSLARNVAAGFGARAEVEYEEHLPATVNTPGIADIARKAADDAVGGRNVVTAAPSMGGEDFSLFLGKVPGCYAFVGLRNDRRGIVYPHHHPRFDLDEDSLATAVDFTVSFARRFLS
jgi:amidohydrolase